MRIARYTQDGVERAGVVSDGRVHPFESGVGVGDVVNLGLDAALALGARAVAGQDSVVLSGVRLLAPIRPASLRDFVAFAEHVDGVRRTVDGTSGIPEAWYDAPTFYFSNPHTIVGPDDDVPFPAHSTARDFELEVAVVLGGGVLGGGVLGGGVLGGGSNLTVGQAHDALFGYTILNDWSARDLQRREMAVNLGPAKGKDFASTLGPWIVTADELEPYRDADGFLDLWCTAHVNGVEVGHDLLSNMGWTFETMIAYASRDSLVVPGDVLGSGTVGNGGCLAELWGRAGGPNPPSLRVGDVVTLTVQGIGSVSNRVATATSIPSLPAVRRRDPARARAGAITSRVPA